MHVKDIDEEEKQTCTDEKPKETYQIKRNKTKQELVFLAKIEAGIQDKIVGDAGSHAEQIGELVEQPQLNRKDIEQEQIEKSSGSAYEAVQDQDSIA
jgi:hypothetical protein